MSDASDSSSFEVSERNQCADADGADEQHAKSDILHDQGQEYEGSQQQQQQTCQICGDISDSQHFGASSCRACAAFFRRTISRRLRYACRFDDNCDFSKTCRAMCKSCRLAKCLGVGMDPNAVRSRQEIEQPIKSELERKPSPPKSTITVAQMMAANQIPFDPLPSRHSAVPLQLPASTFAFAPISFGQANGEETATTSISLLSAVKGGEHNAMKTAAEGTLTASESEATPPKLIVLEEIIRLKDAICIDPLEDDSHAQLPGEYPMLARILLGYNRLDRQRDVRYNRLRESNGNKIRMFVEKQMLDLYSYWQNWHNEVEWVADMLRYFGPEYRQLALAEKSTLLRNFWILFIILERNYDTYNVLGTGTANANGLIDPRMVFANGEIFNMETIQYDKSRIGQSEEIAKIKYHDQTECPLKPWFCRSILEVMPTVRRLQPQPIEIAFCFAVMFWRFPVDVGQKLSPRINEMAQQMVDQIYAELDIFYAKEMPGINQVRRVAELGRLIAITETLALQRKEEIILARTFKAFKVDIYLEDVFGRV